MAKYNSIKNWNELSSYLAGVPAAVQVKKVPLSEWIDYFLYIGGGWRSILEKVKDKAVELNHKGYNNPTRLFNPKNLNEPQQRSVLGHIASRVISSGFIVKIDENILDDSIKDLPDNEKLKQNDYLAMLCRGNAYIRLEGFKKERRSDLLDQISSQQKTAFSNYLPQKTDVEKAIEQVTGEENKPTLEEILNQVEKKCQAEGTNLKPNWRMITERNIKIWF